MENRHGRSPPPPLLGPGHAGVAEPDISATDPASPDDSCPSPATGLDGRDSVVTVSAKGHHGRVVRVLKSALLGSIQIRGVVDEARDLARRAHAAPPDAVAERAALAADFDILLGQIDQIVEDASYAGSNLLAGQPPMPDHDRRITHALLVVLDGLVDNGPLIRYHDLRANPDGLGLEPARNDWATSEDIDRAVYQLDIAHWHVQQSGSELAVNLRILESPTRPAGLETESADGDGAGLILQVRNQLAGTEHGLATPTQKDILRLF